MTRALALSPTLSRKRERELVGLGMKVHYARGNAFLFPLLGARMTSKKPAALSPSLASGRVAGERAGRWLGARALEVAV